MSYIMGNLKMVNFSHPADAVFMWEMRAICKALFATNGKETRVFLALMNSNSFRNNPRRGNSRITDFNYTEQIQKHAKKIARLKSSGLLRSICKKATVHIR